MPWACWARYHSPPRAASVHLAAVTTSSDGSARLCAPAGLMGRGLLLLRALREPRAMHGFALSEWDLVLRQARGTGTVARLCAIAQAAGIFGALPARVRERLETEHAAVAQHHRLIRWEVTRVRRALALAGVPLILLKGAAYLLADLPAARGRNFSDVDVLVPRDRLVVAEDALLQQGWEFTELTAYDQRYYRDWSHELPPMAHKHRDVILDVHHNILPPTGRFRPDPRLLLEAARSLPGLPLSVLAPADMVLHSACHLLQSGELDHSLRDLTDLDSLIRHFCSGRDFWDGLVARAGALGVGRPLYYGLRFAERLLGTPVPAEVIRALAPAAPPRAVCVVTDLLFTEALVPGPSVHSWWRRLALALLGIRYHWLRMPPLLLIRHLLHKALAGHSTTARGTGAR